MPYPPPRDFAKAATWEESALKKNQQICFILMGLLGPDAQTAGCGREGLSAPNLGKRWKTNASRSKSSLEY